MANRLTMAQIDAIVTLHKSGHSRSEIARLLEVDRGTVGKYVRPALVPLVGRRPVAPRLRFRVRWASVGAILAGGISCPTRLVSAR
jgi:hypothetical protein